MSTESIKLFVNDLKTHRESKNITLQVIHNKTRIDSKYLSAIEEGNFDIMPQVYIRAFIKEYARSIELNDEETLKNYEKALQGKYNIDPEEEVLENETNDSEKEKPQKLVYSSEHYNPDNEKNSKSNINIIYVSSGAGAIVLLLLIYFLFGNNSQPEIIKENTFEDVIEDPIEKNNDRFEFKNEEKTDAKILDSLTLKITSKDTTWIRIFIDGSSEHEFIMKPEREKIFKAGSYYTILTGNAGGFDLFLNDKKLEFDGPSGAIRNYKITNDGIITINSEPKKQN